MLTLLLMFRHWSGWLLLAICMSLACQPTEVVPPDPEPEDRSHWFDFDLQPSDGAQVPDPELVPIVVGVRAQAVELHGLIVKLYPRSDRNGLILDIDAHVHGEAYVWGHDLDLSSYPARTTFVLEAAACVDDECAEAVTVYSEFRLP